MLLGFYDAAGLQDYSPKDMLFSSSYVIGYAYKDCHRCKTGDDLVMLVCSKMSIVQLCALGSSSIACLGRVIPCLSPVRPSLPGQQC